MSKTVAVSFEGSNVRVVKASLKGGSLSVDSTQVLPDEEFDSFLQNEKASEFIVASEFRESFHDVLTVPVLKPKLLHTFIESEIRKLIGKREFSFIYSQLGERVVENRNVLDVFYFAVSNEEIQRIVDRFYAKGKMVKALYPSVFAAASLPGTSESDKPAMTILSSGKERTVFFTKGSAIHFIRNYESIDEAFSGFDIQNINMTINYCFQQLRMNPSSIVLMGNLAGNTDVTDLPTAPLVSLRKSDIFHCSTEEFNDFTLPVSSFFATKSSNILSRDFRNIYALKHYLAYASLIFIVLTVLCGGAIVYEFKDISEKKESIEMARRSMSDIEGIYSNYMERESKVSQYRPAVDFLNQVSPELHHLLLDLSGIEFSNFIFDSMEARAKNDSSFSVLINGTGFVNSYSSMQNLMLYLSAKLEKMDGVKISDKKIDLKNNKFIIELEYRDKDEIL